MEANYLMILKKNGLKMTHIARKMGMTEPHLRYYLERSPVDAKIKKKFLATVRKVLKDLNAAIDKTDVEEKLAA